MRAIGISGVISEYAMLVDKFEEADLELEALAKGINLRFGCQSLNDAYGAINYAIETDFLVYKDSKIYLGPMFKEFWP